MSISTEQLEQWMETPKEGENLEFKEAKRNFNFDKLAKYCSALANELGGKLILGVSNKLPRKVVGSSVFKNLGSTRHKLLNAIHIRIEVEEQLHPDGRVVVFGIPARPIGRPIGYKGAFWMRVGENLVPMTADYIKKILVEDVEDFSAEICPGATFDDLDKKAIKRFKDLWIQKSGNKNIKNLTDRQILIDAELLNNEGVTYAAEVLFGTNKGLMKYLGHSEVIIEYRSEETQIRYNQRKEFRLGLFSFIDDLWQLINSRNDMIQFQDGLYQRSIPTFNEAVIREAILNAISHRDYRHQGSILIRQYPRMIEVISPGGFPFGVTLKNFLWYQVPRNRRIAVSLSRCGLVERSGQGINIMFEECIKDGKAVPDYSKTDENQVWLILRGEVQDENFVRFLEYIQEESASKFDVEDFLILDLVNRGEEIPDGFIDRTGPLIESGVIERVGRGRGTRYILSQRYYNFIQKPGQYTRKKGLDKGAKLLLLEQHIINNPGCKLSELQDVLPWSSLRQIGWFLQALKKQGKIHNVGIKNAAKWFPSNLE